MAALYLRVHRSLCRFYESIQFYRTIFRYAARPPYNVPDAVTADCLSFENLNLLEKRLSALDRTRLLHMDRQARIDANDGVVGFSWMGLSMLKAAVLVPLCIVDGQPSVLLTLRSSQLRKHSGEVSFPGGKRDKEDETIIHTAIRECEEEVSLAPLRILGTWHDLPNKDRTLAVTPVVAFMGHIDPRQFASSFNPSEVEEVFTVPIRDLVDPAQRSTMTSPVLGDLLPVFGSGKRRIWGLTAFVLSGILNSIFFPEFSKL